MTLRTLIVDNSANSYIFQPENGVPCSNFIDDKSDRELYALTEWLEKIHAKDVKDVRDHVPGWKRIWKKSRDATKVM